MSQEPNARKNGEQTGIKKKTRKLGQAKNGKRPELSSSLGTLSVAVVTVSVRYPITLTLKSMEDRNISCYSIHDPSATAVIPVFTPGNFSVKSAKGLLRKPEIAAALSALKMAIRNELYFAESTGSESEMHKKETGDNGLKSG